jgi:ferredoxin
MITVGPTQKQCKIGVEGVKATVNQDLCISCGLCVSTCPEVYYWNEEEKAEAVKAAVPSNQEDCAREAADGCPTDAIKTQ